MPASGRIARIMIVDDHPLVREGLAARLARQPDLEVCCEADDASEALRLVREQQPDLAIVDISLKSGSGIDLIKRVRAEAPGVKLLVLSMHPGTLYAERALRAGASGYVNKQEARERVIEATRRVLAGGYYLSPELNDYMLHHLAATRERGQLSVETLSDRELEIFELIGQGLTTKEIAARLHLGAKTVETHRHRIKQKLKLRNAAALAQRAAQWVLEKA